MNTPLDACKFILSQLDPGPYPIQAILYSDCLAPDADGDTDNRTVVDYLREVIAKAEGTK